jgi:hypothetical protein
VIYGELALNWVRIAWKHSQVTWYRYSWRDLCIGSVYVHVWLPWSVNVIACVRQGLVNWLTHFSHINFHAIDLANYPSTLTLKAIWQRMKTVLVSWQVTHLIDSIVRCKVREWGKRQRRQEQVKESEWRITKIRMITWKEIEEKETTERTHLTFNNAGIMSFSQVNEKCIPLFFDFRLSPVGPAGRGGRGWAGWAREGSHLYIYLRIPLSSLSIRPIGLVLNEHKFGPALGFECLHHSIVLYVSGVVHCVHPMHSNQSFHVLNSPFSISFRSLPPKVSQVNVTTVQQQFKSQVKSSHNTRSHKSYTTLCVMKYWARHCHLSILYYILLFHSFVELIGAGPTWTVSLSEPPTTLSITYR